MTNSNDCNGNRTRDLPACSAAPQPAATPRTLIFFLLPYVKSRPFSDKRQSTIRMNINLLNFGSSHTNDLHVCTEVRMHIYIYIYIYVCVCVCVYVCLYVHMYVCMHLRTYVCMFAYAYTNIYMRMYTRVCINIAYVRMSVWMMYVYKSM